MQLILPLVAFIVMLFPSTTYYAVYYNSLYNYCYDYVETYLASEIEATKYDFIVVGAGSSGAVVAYRLSQHYKVLLIEAGGDPSILSRIPGLALDLLGFEEHDWNYKSIPQENMALSHKNQQIYHNRGKVLGGCSTLNYMMYLRGHEMDYDGWANSTGDPNWKYENLLPFFKKSIREYKGEFQDNKKHYESSPYGFLTIKKLKWGKMLNNFLEAGAELGLNSNIDANGPQVSGVGKIEVTQKFGERDSVYAALLQRILSQTNLRISKYSHVTKVYFDASNRATGVLFRKHGKKYIVKALKEVIISAGAYDSPKLLMLSGIGPKEELKKTGITPKVDLPVGKNLQDHFGVFLWPFITSEFTSQMIPRDVGLGDLFEYFNQGTGILTAPTAQTAIMFTSTSKAKKLDWPDIQTFFFPVAPAKYLIINPFANALSIKREVFEEAFLPVDGSDGFFLFSLLTRPKSRGQVTLENKDPLSDPLIDPKPFSHYDDMKTLIEGLNTSLNFVESTNAFKKVDAKFSSRPFSKCNLHTYRSDAYWECYIRHTTDTVWHPVGTCRMSRSDDPTAVVDSQLRVLGTRALRVIDASIMPEIVNANTNAPSILIGERGADFILDYWSNQYLVCNKLQPLRFDYQNKCFYSQKI